MDVSSILYLQWWGQNLMGLATERKRLRGVVFPDVNQHGLGEAFHVRRGQLGGLSRVFHLRFTPSFSFLTSKHA